MNTVYAATAVEECMKTCQASGKVISECASDCNGGAGKSITNPALGNLGNQTSTSFFQNLIPKAIGLAFVGGVLIFLFVFIMGAIQWIASGGDKQGLEAARGKIMNALIGLVILFATFAVIKLIEIFFGISIMALDIGGLVIQ